MSLKQPGLTLLAVVLLKEIDATRCTRTSSNQIAAFETSCGLPLVKTSVDVEVAIKLAKFSLGCE
jgi:hypothetical protein